MIPTCPKGQAYQAFNLAGPETGSELATYGSENAADIEALKEANQRFYDAFGTLDIAEMDSVWEPSEAAMCVHPGWPPIVNFQETDAFGKTINGISLEIDRTIRVIENKIRIVCKGVGRIIDF